jgi:hypothetical protein
LRTTDVSKKRCSAVFGVEMRDMSKFFESQSNWMLLASASITGRFTEKLPAEPVLVKPSGSPLE